MSTTFSLCKRLIALGLTNGLQEKLDTFYAMDRLSMEEYTELSAALVQPEEPVKEEDSAK